MQLKLFVKLTPLLAIAAFAVFTTAAQAQSHFYKNNVLLDSEPIPVASWGTLTYKPSRAAEFTCDTVSAGSLENPEGGGAGTGQTEEFASYDCSSSECPPELGLTPVLQAEGLPWPSQLLIEAPTTARQGLTAVALSAKCFEGATEVGELKFSGDLFPKLHNGTSSLHPSSIEFDSNSGELIGVEESAKIEGKLKLMGYQEQEVISTKGEPGGEEPTPLSTPCPVYSEGASRTAVVSAENKSKLAEEVVNAVSFPVGKNENCSGVASFAERGGELSGEEVGALREGVASLLQPGDEIYAFKWARPDGTHLAKLATLGVTTPGGHETLFEPIASLAGKTSSQTPQVVTMPGPIILQEAIFKTKIGNKTTGIGITYTTKVNIEEQSNKILTSLTRFEHEQVSAKVYFDKFAQVPNEIWKPGPPECDEVRVTREGKVWLKEYAETPIFELCIGGTARER